MSKYEYLNDTSFLNKIVKKHLKEQYVKIVVLDWLEKPIQEVQGIVTGGNINLDGNSAVRRTMNLSVFIKDENYANVTSLNNLFAIDKKMYLEIGYKNDTKEYSQYPII